MKGFNYKKQDFFLSGAVETALLYYYFPTIGAATSVNETALIINQNGVVRFYIGRKGITKAKDEWLNMPTSRLERKFKTWQTKWWGKESEFYKLATASGKWKETLRNIERIGIPYWFESYRVEAIDSFADEIETWVHEGMQKAGIDKTLLYELISPATPTLPQRSETDLRRVREGKMSKERYARKYWYIKGNWFGGSLLRKEDLAHATEHLVSNTDFKSRKQLQEKIDKKLDKRTLQTVKLLRILFLWREERKAFLQMMSIAVAGVIKRGAKDTGIDEKQFMHLMPSEIIGYSRTPNLYKNRTEQSVFYMKKGQKTARILSGTQAETIIKEFSNIEKKKELKGSIASKGRVQGIVRLVLKEHHFPRFQKGEILVTTMTRPEFVPIMSKALAVITDEGGLTSHAAIISRELKIPCIVGTKHATQFFETGDKVEIDAITSGIVKIINK